MQSMFAVSFWSIFVVRLFQAVKKNQTIGWSQMGSPAIVSDYEPGNFSALESGFRCYFFISLMRFST